MDCYMKKYLLYDARYRTAPDRAICCEVCDDLAEARTNAPEYGDDTVIVEAITEGNQIISEKIIN